MRYETSVGEKSSLSLGCVDTKSYGDVIFSFIPGRRYHSAKGETRQ